MRAADAPTPGGDPEAPGRAWRLRVLPSGAEYLVGPGQTLLQATLGGPAPLASSCRNGTCRACLAQVLEGRVHHRIDWPGLSADERAEGWVLPCVAVPDSDVILQQPAPGTSGP